MQVTIPGGTAEIRERPTVGGRELLQETGFELLHQLESRDRPATFAELARMTVSQLDRQLVGATHQLNRAGVVALLKSWTLPKPLPTMDTIADLELDLYDALMEAVAPFILSAMLGEDFSPAAAKDPASPTVPSPGSEPGARAQTILSTLPTPEPSDSSASTDFAASFI